MSFTPAPACGGDLLTRTTLQIEGVMTAGSIAQVTRALQRVPGVLLAEINAATARATVAHDDAVSMDALLTAAVGAGVDAKIVPDAHTLAQLGTSESALQFNQMRARRFLTIAMTLFASFAFIDLLTYKNTDERWLLPLLISAVWIVSYMGTIGHRRP